MKTCLFYLDKVIDIFFSFNKKQGTNSNQIREVKQRFVSSRHK